MEAERQRIDLWCVFFDQVRNPVLLGRCRELMTDAERRQEQRFYFEADRRRYLLTRALVRTTLSRYAAVAPERWSFSSNLYGRPGISSDDSMARRLSFNVAHTHSLIVLAVTLDHTLGVDVENVLRPAGLDFADHCFSRAEVAALNALPAYMRHDRFFDHWTLKEAYIKARGMGLSLPLDQFGFHFQGDSRVDLFISPKLNDVASRWRFWQVRPSAEYVMALCVERTSDSGWVLQARRDVPLGDEETVTYTILRTSE